MMRSTINKTKPKAYYFDMYYVIVFIFRLSLLQFMVQGLNNKRKNIKLNASDNENCIDLSSHWPQNIFTEGKLRLTSMIPFTLFLLFFCWLYVFFWFILRSSERKKSRRWEQKNFHGLCLTIYCVRPTISPISVQRVSSFSWFIFSLLCLRRILTHHGKYEISINSYIFIAHSQSHT